MMTNPDLQKLKPIGRLAKLKGGDTEIWTVSRDLSTIATYNGRFDEFAADSYENCVLRIWDAKTRKERTLCTGKRDDPLECGALSPDGSLLATGGLTELQVWDTSTGACIRTMSHPDATRVKNVRFLSDGAQVLSTTWEAGAAIWDVASGKRLLTLHHEDRLNDLFVSTDESRLLTGNHQSAKVWETSSGACLAVYEHDLEKAAFTPCLSPDGSLYTIISGGETRVFNTADGSERASFRAGRSCQGISPDNRYLCSLLNRQIHIFSLETGDHAASFASEISLDTKPEFIVLPDGRWILFGAARIYELPLEY